MTTAVLKFSQGVTTAPAGRALVVVAGQPVVAANGGDNTGVTRWIFVMLDVPPGSAIPTGAVQDGPTPTYTFTPDVPGCYLLQLTALVTETQYTRSAPLAVGIPEANGLLIPPVGADAGALNFSGQDDGWAGANLLRGWLEFVRDNVGTGGPGVIVYDLLAGSKTTDLTTVTPEPVGTVRFDAADHDPDDKTRHVTFEAVLFTTNAPRAASIRIWDEQGVTNANVPTTVAGSTLSSSETSPTLVTADLTSVLGEVGTCLLEARLAIEAPGGGYATCAMARLVVTWT